MAVEGDVVHRLEEAASLVLSPPNIVSADKRAEAEAVFHQMRRICKPYSFCQSILETNCSDYVQFQSVVTMKEAVLREWLTIPLEERLALKSYLLDYISKRSSLPQYIQRHISVLLAVIIKRGVLEPENGSTVLSSYINDISQLVTSSLKIELGCSLLSVLLVEFSSSSGSSAIGMPLEFHVKCKKALEDNGGLLLILTLAIQTIDSYVRTGLVDTSCFSSLLTLSIEILSWDFRSTYFYRSQHLLSSMTHVPFKPPSSFRNVVLNTAILDLFVQCFSHCTNHSELVHKSLQCLSQLASLCGPVFTSREDSMLYLNAFLQSFLPALTNGHSFSNDTVYDVANIFRQLVTTFSLNCFSSLNGDTLQALVKTLTDYHQLCAQRIIVLESNQEDEQLVIIEESQCFLMEVIVRLLEGSNQLIPYFKESLLNILSVYLSSKLNVPYGSKQYQSSHCLNVEIEEDDRRTYGDELSYIGTISRYILTESLRILLDLFIRCYSKCVELCQALLSDSSCTTVVRELESLYEDLHWLMLITTFTLTDVMESEECNIPDEILIHSSTYQLQSSFSMEELVINITNNTSIDPVVGLIACVCHWSLIERQLIDKGLKELVSPQVCETATWSMCTVFSTYLIPSTKYDQMSSLLAQLVVNDTEDSRWLLSFVVDKISYNCTVWYAEEKLMLTSVISFGKLARTNKTRAIYLCHNETLWLLMRSFTSGEHPISSLSLSLQKETMGALMSCAGGEKRDQFITELLEPLCVRFQVQINSLTKSGETTDEERSLLLLLESWDGVITATHNTLVDLIFPILYPILSTCVQLLEVSEGEVSLAVLRIFCHVAEYYTIFLNDNDVNRLYQVSLQLITMYSKYQTGKYSHRMIADEDQCEDLTFIIQTLSHLTTKDYIDFGSSEDSTHSSTAVSPVSVVLTGLSVVLPIINEDILKFPDLCKTFYELVHYICEIFPDSFCSIQEDLLHYTFKLIDLGCVKFSTDITLLCVECIESVCKASSNGNADILINYSQYFLKQLLSRVLNHVFESDLFSSFSASIYQLMCSLKEHGVDLNNVLLTGSDNSDSMRNLLKVATPLLTGSRPHKKQFKTCLMDLLPHLRSDR